MTIPKSWEENFRIHSFHMDPKGKAHLTSICNFLQEGASMHAETAGFGYRDLLAANQVWVLVRLKVLIYIYPEWKEEIKLKTWSRGNEGIFYIRDFIIKNEKQEVIVKATSSWAAINTKTRRPELVAGLEEGMYSLKDEKAIDRKLEKLPRLKNPQQLRAPRIEYSDIDLLYHVNNVKYIELIINSFPLEINTTMQVKSIEINYMGEAKYGEKVIISSELNGNIEHDYLVNIIRKSDRKEVCRARLVWEQHTSGKPV